MGRHITAPKSPEPPAAVRVRVVVSAAAVSPHLSTQPFGFVWGTKPIKEFSHRCFISGASFGLPKALVRFVEEQQRAAEAEARRKEANQKKLSEKAAAESKKKKRKVTLEAAKRSPTPEPPK